MVWSLIFTGRIFTTVLRFKILVEQSLDLRGRVEEQNRRGRVEGMGE